MSPQYGAVRGFCACTKGSSRNHDLLPILRGISNKQNISETPKYIHMLTASRTEVNVCCPFTLKKIKEAKKKSNYKIQSKGACLHEGIQHGTSKYQVSLGHFAMYKTLIYEQLWSYTSVP